MNTLQDQCHLSLHHTKPYQQSEAIAQTLQDIELPFQTITIRNDGKTHHIEAMFPYYNSATRQTLSLDANFIDIIPKHIDELSITTAQGQTITLLHQPLINNLNNFLQGNGKLSNSLRGGDCLDFVYELIDGDRVSCKDNALTAPHKDQFVPFNPAQAKAYQPLMFYQDQEWKHASIYLGNGLALSRMGSGGELMITTVQTLAHVYGSEIMILDHTMPISSTQ